MEKKKYEKQRRGPRVETAIPVRWGVTKDCPRYGKIINLSSRGCLIESQIEPLNGKTVFLRFGLPTGHSISLEGNPVKYRRGLGFSIEFVELSEEDSYTLEQLVEYYREMSPDDPRHGQALLADFREALKSITTKDEEG
ncbi:MAG: PilZ domain-containing protein [Pyrinomonadaceae bacterium]|nr:PilZ domain-containing protein [Pyrinomonadaceae bacterium]